MYNTYYFLFGFLFLAFMAQTGQLVLRLYPYFENYLKGIRKLDPTKDRMRIFLSLFLYTTPLFLIFLFKNNYQSFDNDQTNYIILLLFSFGILYIIYATEKGLWREETSMFFKKNNLISSEKEKKISINTKTEIVQKKFNDLFESEAISQEILRLLKMNNFYPIKRAINPIELNILILKLEKLNLFKDGLLQKEIVFVFQKKFGVSYGEDNYSKLKTSYENDSISELNTARLLNLDYLNHITKNKI